MRWFKRKLRQTCWVYCPTCRFELCAGGEFLSDDENGVKYRCASCGTPSTWDFDTFPVPVLMAANGSSGEQA